MPGERLFRGIHRWAAGDAHRQRLHALGLLDYRLHDSRHHWAVRMVRAGMPLELVARQLGHRDVVMVAKVYGRFVPNHQERDRWEHAAAALDIEKWGQMGTVAGTSAPATEASEVANINDVSDFENSRGGTRTRDPGIMSAVL
jgi:Phage integrase family